MSVSSQAPMAAKIDIEIGATTHCCQIISLSSTLKILLRFDRYNLDLHFSGWYRLAKWSATTNILLQGDSKAFLCSKLVFFVLWWGLQVINAYWLSIMSWSPGRWCCEIGCATLSSIFAADRISPLPTFGPSHSPTGVLCCNQNPKRKANATYSVSTVQKCLWQSGSVWRNIGLTMRLWLVSVHADIYTDSCSYTLPPPWYKECNSDLKT